MYFIYIIDGETETAGLVPHTPPCIELNTLSPAVMHAVFCCSITISMIYSLHLFYETLQISHMRPLNLLKCILRMRLSTFM